MTAAEKSLTRIKPTTILSQDEGVCPHSPLPYYWSWYRIVFDCPVKVETPPPIRSPGTPRH